MNVRAKSKEQGANIKETLFASLFRLPEES